MKGILKGPLIIAAIVVVARVVVERMSGPPALSAALSAVALYMLIIPMYLAVRIAGAGVAHPYRTLLKNVGIYAAITRFMVIVTYWLAYIFQWPEGRFSVEQGGVVGEGVGPLRGFVLVPFGVGILWVIGAVLIGGGLASIVLAILRMVMPRQQSSRS